MATKDEALLNYERAYHLLHVTRIAKRMPVLAVVCATLVVFLSLDVLISYASKNDYGTYDYTSSSVVAYVEFMKIAISLSLLLYKPWPEIRESVVAVNWRIFLLSALPAALYAINNNLVFTILRHLEPAIFQVVSNFKIISTALLMRVFLRRRFTQLHYLTLFLLIIVISWTQYSPSSSRREGGSIGFVLALLYTFNSSLASVYTEYVLKRHSHISVHVMNTQLYFWGVAFNLAYWLLVDRDPVRSNFFSGWTPVVWLLVLTMSCSGLLISSVMRFADNLVKIFCSSISVVLCIYVSSLLFGIETTMQHLFGALSVSAVIILYNQLPPASPHRGKGGMVKEELELGVSGEESEAGDVFASEADTF
ncbi:Nucleotide-sugar transporter [Carpediemonas membranifera]|uniref:Nucleotide-sugar transporter n=1 Tax=Carpediemonas membranifera TaxID=201153 RepID=A0A8J6DXH2_9EUKA|nr:Nucleotide-sugar transporter [Carpediemonas membranifera]|eukprot:KAG9390144.1 Nucleotide-sugar transporter [Carpediemonas membranifera]